MVAEAKIALRRQLRTRRARLDPRQRAAETRSCVAALLEWLADLGWPPVASYAAAGSELDLDALHRRLWRRGSTLLLPRVGGERHMTWHRVGAATQLVPGYRDIREPDPSLAPETSLHAAVVLLVPGLGFTADGHRLGQGGGFYDTALAAAEFADTVGIGFGCQLLDAIPREAHDARVERVLLGGEWVL